MQGKVFVDDDLENEFTGSPISGVAVTLTNVDALAGGIAAGTVVKIDTTDGAGEFKFENFYVGATSATWIVTPTYLDHPIIPTNRAFDLNTASPEEDNLFFEDNASFSFTGKAFQFHNGIKCGLDDVVLSLVNGGFTESDQNGNYELAIPNTGTWTVIAELPGQEFNQLSPTFIGADASNNDIEATTTRNIDFSFKGGCESVIGTVEVTIRDSISCVEEVLSTDLNSGSLSISLPAREYNVIITGYTPVPDASTEFTNLFNETQILNYFTSNPITADLRLQDTAINLVYHPIPTIEVFNWPEKSCPELPYANISQEESVELFINTWDIPPNIANSLPNGCPLDTGILYIENSISSYTDEPLLDTISVNGEQISFPIFAGAPNLGGDHEKYFVANLINEDGFNSNFTDAIIAEGVRARENTFTTVSPEVPLHILRDPPGDNSYASLSAGQTSTTYSSVSSGHSGGFNVYAKAVLDREIKKNIKFWGEVGASFTFNSGIASSTESENTTTITNTYETSANENPNDIGESADVYVGAAFNMIYALSDVVEVNDAICEVDLSTRLMVNPDTFATTYIYSTNTIENNIIPSLKELVALTVDPDSMQYFTNQITVWEDVLAVNDEVKSASDFEKNYSVGAGVVFNSSESIEKTETVTSEWEEQINLDIFANVGGVVQGFGAEFGGEINLQWNSAGSTATSTGTSMETEFTINDNDSDGAGDLFSFDVLRDEMYGTAYFDVAAAETSCPYEEGTLPRHDASLTAIPNTFFNVPADEGANFTLILTNTSQSGETMSYFLDYNSTSNHDGAEVSYNEVYESNRIELAFGESFTFSGIEVTPNNSNGVYTYQGIEFRVYAACLNGGIEYAPDESRVISSTKLNVHFIPPCTELNLQEPRDNWVSSTANNNALSVHFTDYDFLNIDLLLLEYSTAAGGSWQTGINIPVNTFNFNSEIGTTVDWSTANIPDGEYRMRLKVICGNESFTTPIVNGVIDKNPPEKLGYPKPKSRTLTLTDDIIGVTFNEPITPEISNENIEFINVTTGDPVEFNMFAIDNNIYVSPTLDLASLSPAFYKLIYSNISDLYGNVMAEPIEWTFTVGEISRFVCDENRIFYVDKNVDFSSTQDGLTWQNAFTNLNDAFKYACDGSKVYVAEGTYYPTDHLYSFNSDMLDTIPGDSIYFEWKRDFSLYGGFASGGADFDERNPNAYPTIISGDANKDGVRNEGDCHILIKVTNDNIGRLEGFTLGGVYSDGSVNGISFIPGAIYNEGDVEIVNCIISNNQKLNDAFRGGAAVFNLKGSPKFVNCVFDNNSSVTKGGAIYMGSISASTNFKLINSSFYNNSASSGAAIWTNGDDLTIQNSIFYGNPGTDIQRVGSSNVLITHSSYEESAFAVGIINGEGNILNNDPQFIDAPNGNFNLSSSSNCIDIGVNNVVENIVNLDLESRVRIMSPFLNQNPIIDLGALEVGPCTDVTDQSILYVDIAPENEGNGFSWSSPYTKLSKALTKGKLCGIDSIYVAEGIYYPDLQDLVNPKEAAFVISDEMVVLGGYPSGGGERNASKNTTILSGNIGNALINDDNSYNVVRFYNVSSNTLLDGFTITDGNADENLFTEGGGIRNEANGYDRYSNPTIKNCIILNNSAQKGGGIANLSTNEGLASMNISHTIIKYNSALLNGGGLYDSADDEGNTLLKINNSLVHDNRAAFSGGGIYQLSGNASQSNATAVNITFANNICGENTSGEGGAISLNTFGTGNASSKIYNSILHGNKNLSGSSNQLFQSLENTVLTLKNNNIEGGYGGSSVMEFNFDTLPYFAGAHVDNFALDACSPMIDKGDQSKVNSSFDLFLDEREIGIVDIGATEYDGISRRNVLPESMDDIILNCIRKAQIDIPSDGISYAIYNDTLSVLLAGPAIGDQPDKVIETSNIITSDTTLSIIINRDASYGIDLENAEGVIEFNHAQIQVFDPDLDFEFWAHIFPTNAFGKERLWYKENNLGIGFDDADLWITTYNNDDITIPNVLTGGEWQEIHLSYSPFDELTGMIVVRKNGEEVGRKLLSRAASSSPLPLFIGGNNSTENFDGKIDFLAANKNGKPIIQLDFLSAQGSDKAFDLRMAADGGAAQEGLLDNLDRYQIWLSGTDQFVKLCPDTLTLNILIDPITQVRFVESHLDDGVKTLRWEIFNACPNDTIRFANILMGDTVKFESEIFLDKDLFIEGLGMNGGTTLDGQGFTRLFDTKVNMSVTFKDMQMINGSHSITGGAVPIPSECTLYNVRFKGNNTTGNKKAISLLPFSNLKLKGDVILNE